MPETAKGRLGRWVARGSWAATEQALFAATNFAINLALARLLSPESYGAFGMVLAMLFLLSSAQDALLSEPVLVLGAGKYHGVFVPYVSTVVGWQWLASALSGGILILFGLGALVISPPTVSMTYLAAGIAAPGFLYMGLARAVCYSCQQPRVAAVGGAVNLLAVFAAGGVLEYLGLLSAPVAFFLIGGGGLLAGATMLHRLGVPVVGGRNGLSAAPVVRDHWRYGRWILASSAANWATGNLYLVVLPTLAGLAVGGALVALMLFVRPLLTMLTPVVLVMVPLLVRHRDRPDFAKLVILPMIGLVAGCSLYWAALAIAHGPLVVVVLGGKYVEYSSALIVIGAVPVLASASRVLVSGLRALGRPDLEFRATLSSAAVSMTAGMALVALFSIWGATIGLVLSAAVLAIGAALALRRLQEPNSV